MFVELRGSSLKGKKTRKTEEKYKKEWDLKMKIREIQLHPNITMVFLEWGSRTSETLLLHKSNEETSKIKLN